MSFSAQAESKTPEFKAEAQEIQFENDVFKVILCDGREINIPLEWFPRLKSASPEERDNWELIGNGIGIHWPEIDEDISVEQLLSSK